MLDGDIVGAGEIDCDDIVLDSDGGGTGINMSSKAISNAKSIVFKDTATNVFTGGASNKVVFTNCD